MIAIVLAFVALAPLVAADSFALYCLQDGEQIDFSVLCNPLMPTLTGPTNVCVRQYDGGQICPTNINTCNTLSLTCGSAANTTIDQTPPELTITSPAQDEVYQSRSILLDFSLNERSTVHYKDNNSPNQQWRVACNDCLSYDNPRSFEEGLNDLTFRATDRNGNQAFFEVSFRVDSKDPQVKKTEPRRGFVSGDFYIEIREDNPTELKVVYGNFNEGMFEHLVNIEEECEVLSSTKTACNTFVDMSLFDGQDIQYYAELTDIAGNVDQSQPRDVSVDYSDPQILSEDVSVDGRFATFVIELDEVNFEEATYIDLLDDNPRERRLCSRLENGVCEDRVSFRDGQHEILVTVFDEAGNSAQYTTSFFTDSRRPRIMRTEPRRGYASGFFSMQFREDNPLEALLHYGNSAEGMREASVDLDSCFEDRGRMNCELTVDLEDYDGQQIQYWFSMEDLVGSTDESRVTDLDVDTTYPLIDSITHEYAYSNRYDVTLFVDEENLDEIHYLNNNEPNPRERRFCSRLEDDGSCDKRINLYPGVNSIDFQVIDEAGNSVAQNYEIVI